LQERACRHLVLLLLLGFSRSCGTSRVKDTERERCYTSTTAAASRYINAMLTGSRHSKSGQQPRHSWIHTTALQEQACSLGMSAAAGCLPSSFLQAKGRNGAKQY
jgi:hypothetical protein